MSRPPNRPRPGANTFAGDVAAGLRHSPAIYRLARLYREARNIGVGLAPGPARA